MSYLTLLAIFTSIIAITSGAPNRYPFLIQVRGSAGRAAADGMVETLSQAVLVCPGGSSHCPSDAYTCCQMLSGLYGCCQMSNAVCCANHVLKPAVQRDTHVMLSKGLATSKIIQCMYNFHMIQFGKLIK